MKKHILLLWTVIIMTLSSAAFALQAVELNKKAADMLVNSNKEIDEIADAVNYEYGYFCKIFKKHFGKTPRQYRAASMNQR